MTGDLSPLAGKPIIWLDIPSCPVEDLTPDKHAKLEHTTLPQRGFLISRLKAMPLMAVAMSMTPVSDWSPLGGTPLQFLDATEILASDLSVPRGLPLTPFAIDFDPQQQMKLLRTLQDLSHVDDTTAAK